MTLISAPPSPDAPFVAAGGTVAAESVPTMGIQPGLDGLRAVSVAIVVAYHAGLGWMHGGFFGVEVFFVVSGFLITTLLLEEQHRSGRISLRSFWLRRARRLLPALFVVLAGVSLWAVLVQPEFTADLRRTLLPAVFYVSNWAEIFGEVPYFSPASPPLRHLWSLAVEEQWYLLWPLAFVLVSRLLANRPARRAAFLAAASLSAMAWSAWLATSNDPTISVAGQRVDRFNFIYLNTFGRASGLLLGAAVAVVWRPWERRTVSVGRSGRLPDVVGMAAVVAIVVIAATRPADVLVDPALYHLWMPVVTVLSIVAVAVVVDPRSTLSRRALGWRPLVLIGQRSYGIYLWHWPVFAFAGVRGDPARIAPALLITAGLSELCLRLVERPIRSGSLTRWSANLREHGGAVRARWLFAAGLAGLMMVAGITLSVRGVREVDPAIGDQQVSFDVAGAVAGEVAVSTSPGAEVDGSVIASVLVGSSPVETVSIAPTAPSLPRRLLVLGDSQAMSLASNLPAGVDEVFTVTDGSIEGCSVQSTGKILTARSEFSKLFRRCADWEQRWADAARSSEADLALVVIGAWDVFDHEVDGVTIPFASAEGDERFVSGVERGIEVLRAEGVHVALLEIPCMRPIDVDGAGVPALPERAEDWRVAHLNDLLRRVAADRPEAVTFVPGPAQWCADPVVGNDPGYRWDGVHVYQLGAKLIMETITAPLLAIPL